MEDEARQTKQPLVLLRQFSEESKEIANSSPPGLSSNQWPMHSLTHWLILTRSVTHSLTHSLNQRPIDHFCIMCDQSSFRIAPHNCRRKDYFKGLHQDKGACFWYSALTRTFTHSLACLSIDTDIDSIMHKMSEAEQGYNYLLIHLTGTYSLDQDGLDVSWMRISLHWSSMNESS